MADEKEDWKWWITAKETVPVTLERALRLRRIGERCSPPKTKALHYRIDARRKEDAKAGTDTTTG